jgi:hypothetical protein
MSESDSDCSLDTEELNEIKGDIKETFEVVEVKGVEREKIKKKIKKKTEEEQQKELEEKEELKDYNKSYGLDEKGEPLKKEKPKKKREMSEKQKEALKKGREKALENRKNKPKSKYIYTEPSVEELKKHDEELEKKKRGRPKTKEIIKTEKIIYMIPNEETGEYEKVTNPPKLTARDLKKIDREKKAKEKEIELGKKLVRKKNGDVDNRSARTLTNGRTNKQIEATRKMLEANKKRRADKMKIKEEKQTETMKKEITNTIVDVVSQPAEIVRAKRERSEDQIKKDKLRKALNLFS